MLGQINKATKPRMTVAANSTRSTPYCEQGNSLS